MHIPTAESPFGTVTGRIPQASDNHAPHVPSQWRLEQQIAEADRKFEADRKAALEERFERACSFNRRAARDRHENNLVKMPRSSGYKVPR